MLLHLLVKILYFTFVSNRFKLGNTAVCFSFDLHRIWPRIFYKRSGCFFPFKWCDFATVLQWWSLASIMMRLLSVFINVQWRELPHMLLQPCDSKVWGMDVCPCLDLTTVLIDFMWSAGWMWLKRTHTPSVYHMFVFLAGWE